MEGLARMLQNPYGSSENLLGRMLIVEDLTADLVELLGSSLEIDPLFFASHLHTSRSRKTAKLPDTRLLPSAAKHLKFLSATYHRPISFAADPVPGKLLCDANVWRKVGAWPAPNSVSVGYAMRVFSTLVNFNNSGIWFGLALVDPPVGNTFFMDGRGQQEAQTPVLLRSEQFQGGYDAFPFTKPSSSEGVHSPPRCSLFDDLIYCWMEELPSVFDPRAPTLLSLSYYPLKIIVAEWMNFANLMHYTVENLEYSIEDLSTSLSEFQRLESDLRRLQGWRRRVVGSSSKMDSLTHAIKSLSSEPPFLETWESLLGDIEHVIYRTNMYGQRLDALVPVLSSYVQVVESRGSIAEAKSITRLTYLALVFLPLTFVSGLFSMSEDILPGRKNFWIYFAVAIPLTVVVLFTVARLLT
ncbi:hypothetical protein FGG08_006553 [Glutinoglossum americanum]|uniref:Uncharacterized protein n=1 Tax=Glutinoglossum americanum TaxID=1670608 RepID=A0A9P8HY35_9PEZI|nr:hypothetical protein FGG08_006553 [Glutinoglossum americanum]